MNSAKIPSFKQFIDPERYHKCLEATNELGKAADEIEKLLEPLIGHVKKQGKEKADFNLLVTLLVYKQASTVRAELHAYLRMIEIITSLIVEMIRELDQSTGSVRKHNTKLNDMVKTLKALHQQNVEFSTKRDKIDFVVDGIAEILDQRGISLDDLVKDKKNQPKTNTPSRTPSDGTLP